MVDGKEEELVDEDVRTISLHVNHQFTFFHIIPEKESRNQRYDLRVEHD